MNKELCIKVGKWNNSILWCTVENTSKKGHDEVTSPFSEFCERRKKKGPRKHHKDTDGQPLNSSSFLTLVLDVGEWVTWRPGRFTRRKERWYLLEGEWAPASVWTYRRNKNPLFLSEFEPRAVQSVALPLNKIPIASPLIVRTCCRYMSPVMVSCVTSLYNPGLISILRKWNHLFSLTYFTIKFHY